MKNRSRAGRRGLFAVCCPAWLLAAVSLAVLPVSAAQADGRKDETGTAAQLYAQAAVLMDADNGRILLEKNGDEVLPMASTTKIMTCILTLEQGDTEEIAAVSAYAAGQPRVRLGARKGEYYQIGDLLYSLMLESHNDAAVIIAEHFGSKWAGLSQDCSAHSSQESQKAVLAFVQRMNEKARLIGCTDTSFVTPNGLDATLTLEKGGQTREVAHSTTAADLARIMSYCVTASPEREQFLTITRQPSYSYESRRQETGGGFSAGGRTVSCINHNAFLEMMEGALSGKTGFTGKAGYCYVGALERDGKTFAVALLACGWPNNKTWKWHDARLLMEYGLENYEFREIGQKRELTPVPVENGQSAQVELVCGEKPPGLLLSEHDTVEVKWELPGGLTAPVEKGQPVGKELFYVNGELYASLAVTAAKDVEAIDFPYCLRSVLAAAFL